MFFAKTPFAGEHHQQLCQPAELADASPPSWGFKGLEEDLQSSDITGKMGSCSGAAAGPHCYDTWGAGPSGPSRSLSPPFLLTNLYGSTLFLT